MQGVVLFNKCIIKLWALKYAMQAIAFQHVYCDTKLEPNINNTISLLKK